MVDVSFFRRILHRIHEDDVAALAAQLAYFLLLSMFPLLIFLVSLLPYLPITNQDIITFIQEHTPVEQSGIINVSVEEVLSKNNTILSFSILATLWSASNGINAIVRAFNKAYRVEQERSLKVRFKSIFLTLAMIFVFVMALLLPVFGKEIGEFLFSQFGLRAEFLSVWEALRWLISFFVLFLVFTCLYWIAPNIKMKCRHALPGAIVATIGWVVVSWGFSFYVSNFAQYTVIYGQIGGVIVLLLWLYLAAFTIIIGGEINAYFNEQKKVC